MRTAASHSSAHRFQIRFPSVPLHERPMAFPCDAEGNVDMDRLSEVTRSDYFFARIMIRRQSAKPEVVRDGSSSAEQAFMTC